MNRDQARHLIANLDLIRHFADGGDIGHRLIDCTGKQVRISPTDKILISNMHGSGTLYVKVKPKYAVGQDGIPKRVRRCWTENIQPHELMPCEHREHIK